MNVPTTQTVSLKYNIDWLAWTIHHLPGDQKFSFFDRCKADLREYMDALDDEREITDPFCNLEDFSNNGPFEILIPIETLMRVVENLAYDSKFSLWEMLNEDLADYEDHLLATNPEIQKEIEEAKASVERSEYVTLEDFLAEDKEKTADVSSSNRE
ncbi:MAG: hypothetical protein O7E52_10120 [Candidatus Poribacteria bacterium]|nr:hypothetical protein [Candidatus Poribacteria bacterium]